MSHKTELPVGTVILESAQPDGAELDVGLAVELARLGASSMLVRAVGGDQAVHEAEAITGNRNGSA
jgi:hypothetical protein